MMSPSGTLSFQSYKELLLVLLCSACRAGLWCLQGEAWSSLSCSFSAFGCSEGQLCPAGPVPGHRRLEEAAPQLPGEAVQGAAAARRVHHGEPGVNVGLQCLSTDPALLERSLELAARPPVEGGDIPPRPGCWSAVRRAEVPVEVTAGLLGSKGFALVTFCFTLRGSDHLASPLRITLLYRKRGWDRVLQEKPNISFMGLRTALNLLKKIWKEHH